MNPHCKRLPIFGRSDYKKRGAKMLKPKYQIPIKTTILDYSKKYPQIPIIACWRVSYSQVAFWCDHCKQFHFHGWANGRPDGHRGAHCNKGDSPFNKTGYILKCVGSLYQEGFK